MLTSGSSALARRDLGIAVSFRFVDGAVVTADLADAWAQPCERLAPFRRLMQYKGQRNFTGSWWCATTGGHVGYESWVERNHVMLFDFAQAVVGISSQPFSIELAADDGPRRHVPDYFVREAKDLALQPFLGRTRTTAVAPPTAVMQQGPQPRYFRVARHSRTASSKATQIAANAANQITSAN